MSRTPIEIKSVIATVTLNLIFHVVILLILSIVAWLINNFFVFIARWGSDVRVIALRTSNMKYLRICQYFLPSSLVTRS
ncbi:MAG: hypothetical protein ACP5OH_02375 [Nitrososphaerota archaeon]